MSDLTQRIEAGLDELQRRVGSIAAIPEDDTYTTKEEA